MHQQSLDQLPDVLTISEVARFLRVSTAVVYGMVGRYRRTNGREGMPVFMAGARMRRAHADPRKCALRSGRHFGDPPVRSTSPTQTWRMTSAALKRTFFNPAYLQSTAR